MRNAIVIGAIGVALCTVSAAAGGSQAPFSGIVVGHQGGALLVTSPAGLVRTLVGHATIGSRIALAGGRLSILGRARTARIRGVVVRRIGSTLFVASNRHIVAVRAARLSASVSSPAPVVGDDVDEQVTIASGGQLDEDASETTGHQSSATVQGVVTAVGPGTVTLNVNGQSLTLPLPNGLTLPASVVGQTVTIQVSLGNDDEQGDDNDEQGSTTTTTTTDDDGGGDR